MFGKRATPLHNCQHYVVVDGDDGGGGVGGKSEMGRRVCEAICLFRQSTVRKMQM